MKKPCLGKTIINIVGCAWVLGFVLINSAQASTLILKVLDSSKQPMTDVTVQVKTVAMGAISTMDVKTDCLGQVTLIGNSGGSSCIFVKITYSLSAPGYTFSPSDGDVPCSPLTEIREIIASGPPQPARPVTIVSAASFLLGPSPSESIGAAFGANLATTTEIATSLPLPTTLAGRTVLVKDINGVEKTAPLFFVSPLQINFLMPEGLASGQGSVTVVGGDQPPIGGCIVVRKVEPSIFTANADGQGVAAAVALRVKADGSQIYEPVIQFDATQNRFVAFPIDLGPDLGPASDRVFLVLFGSGFRNRNSLSDLLLNIGDEQAGPEFADEQGTFPGLDQMNILLSRRLVGRGVVNVALTGRHPNDSGAHISNTVQINIK